MLRPRNISVVPTVPTEITNTVIADTSYNMDLSEANLGLVSLELTRENTSKQWPLNGYEHEDEVNHILKLHQVIVDRKAAKDEEQVIEVEFFPNMGNKVSMPLAFLKRGQLDQLRMEINFPAGTTFHLAEGQGPVYLLGSHTVTQASEEDVGESEDVEEEEDEEDENLDAHEIRAGEAAYDQGKPPATTVQGLFDENGSKKRKQDLERENGTDAKKLKATPPSANSDSDGDREDDDDSPDME